MGQSIFAEMNYTGDRCIYCEYQEKPDGWNEDWNKDGYMYIDVEWGASR